MKKKKACGKYSRHLYRIQIDSDGNYRVCERCKKCSFRLGRGERDRVRSAF